MTVKKTSIESNCIKEEIDQLIRNNKNDKLKWQLDLMIELRNKTKKGITLVSSIDCYALKNKPKRTNFLSTKNTTQQGKNQQRKKQTVNQNIKNWTRKVKNLQYPVDIGFQGNQQRVYIDTSYAR